MDYNQTVHLPQTDFPMRAGLPKREPEMLQEMYDHDLYHKMVKRNEGKPTFVLHDGPPYANGNIHIGTALNKILKDMIVKHRNMTGWCAPLCPRLGHPRPAHRVRRSEGQEGKAGRDDHRPVPPPSAGNTPRATSRR